MKILFITNGFPPQQWAGTETYTAGLAQELRQRGHEVRVLCGGAWDKGSTYWNGVSDESYQGVKVRRINLNWSLAPDPFGFLYRNPVTADYVAGFVEEIQPDIVHVTSCDILSASVLGIVKDLGLPLVLSLTDFWFLCPRWNLLRSDGENCSGVTSAWECLQCNLLNEKAYRWPSSVLPESIVAPLLTKASQFPLVSRLRGFRGMAGDMSDRKHYLKEALTLPDYRITASEFARDIFVKNGLDVPIHVQAYGHDLRWLESFSGKTESKTLRLGFIGQINYSKGVHLLLQAMQRLVKEGITKEISLAIYGNVEHDPDYSAQLFKMAGNLPNVQFCGVYTHDESGGVFSNIDVLVVPSLWYDFPLIIHEAFATVTPVVATNLGGMAEVVTHNVSGLLFDRGEVEDLAAQLRRILVEPELLQHLRNGVPPVKPIDAEVDELEAIYTKLLIK